MFEKMGVSLAESGYEVYIIGFQSSRKPDFPGIHCIALPHFNRLSVRRWLAKWRVLSKIIQLKPAVAVISTHELLVPAVILKVLTSIKIVYDIRENYSLNILHAGTFPAIMRPIIAGLVRIKENMTSPFIDHFLLAEKGYDHEFSFHQPRCTVIENKALASSRKPATVKDRSVIQLLFSGTLAESTGIYHAIHLCLALHQRDARITLTIIGYAALPEDRQRIRDAAKGHPYIRLMGVDQLVPHDQVTEQIQRSDFGILAYPPALHTMNSRPTKLYEYLSAGLPIILESRWPWIEDYEVCRPFVFVDFSSPDLPKLEDDLTKGSYYTAHPEDVTWDAEARKLLALLERL